MYNIYYIYYILYIILYIYIYQTILYLVSLLGYRHNNNCSSDLYRNITLGHRTHLASLVGTYRHSGNISWYRLKATLILY